MLTSLPRRRADFATFAEALDYAAQGVRGLNFHDPRGVLTRAYTFTELRADALKVAYRLIARGVVPGDRIALIAETGPDFATLFCGAVYAGAWPVPLPLPTSFGGKDSYIDQIAVQMKSAEPTMLVFPEELAAMAGAAAAQQGCEGICLAGVLAGSRTRGRRCPSCNPKTSASCNIPADRPASRTASRSASLAARQPCSPQPRHEHRWR